MNLDADNNFVDQLHSYDEAEAALIMLAQQGSKVQWATGDILLKQLPPAARIKGRPATLGSEKIMSSLARAAGKSRSQCNRLWLTSHYYPRSSDHRQTLVNAGVLWSYCDVARTRVIPATPALSVKEALYAADSGITVQNFGCYLHSKYVADDATEDKPDTEPFAITLSIAGEVVLTVKASTDKEAIALAVEKFWSLMPVYDQPGLCDVSKFDVKAITLGAEAVVIPPRQPVPIDPTYPDSIPTLTIGPTKGGLVYLDDPPCPDCV